MFFLPVLLSVAFCSCILEESTRCPATRNLLFTRYSLYDPDESFDNHIARDVLLCVYKDDKLATIELIPYEQIKGNRMYSSRKEFGGNLHFAAWAVPAGSQASMPQCAYGEDIHERFLEMEAGALGHLPTESIYLGSESVIDDDVMVETTHKIKMIDAVCTVLVTVDDPTGKLDFSNDGAYVLLDGVMSKMDMFHCGAGVEAEVYVPFSGKQGDYYSTGYFGVLPSGERQSIGINLYYGGQCLAVVDTGEKALPGGRIIVHIIMGLSVSIEVNDWVVTPLEVKWM